MNRLNTLEELRDIVLGGAELTDEQAYILEEHFGNPALREYAEEITRKYCTREFDSCSIINARSGKCSENCKWCAQSAHFKGDCEVYDIVNHDECIALAKYNHDKGVNRFSLVASGKAVKGKALERMCEMLDEIHRNVGIKTCASLGLIGAEEFEKLKKSHVTRYHCNLESAPSHFPTLCSTHTIGDKLATIRAAREAGMEICSGGIIGMGETIRQRIEFALLLREIRPVSIPINVLVPIPGTPLENMPPLSEDEIVDTISMMRFIHPRAFIRFAGGRTRLSRENQLASFRIAVNGAITGDMLTTTGTTIDSDKALTKEAGYN